MVPWDQHLACTHRLKSLKMSQLSDTILNHSISHHLNKKGPIRTHMQLRFTAYVLSILNQRLNITKYNQALYIYLW